MQIPLSRPDVTEGGIARVAVNRGTSGLFLNLLYIKRRISMLEKGS